jgi:hypothetical protein
MLLLVQLAANWVLNRKIVRVGLDGRGLHATALCLAKLAETDGWIHRSLLHREGADDALIDRLVELRLFEADGDNVRPWGWHRRNPSQGAIDATRSAKADAAKAGNHTRWKHPGDVADCPICNPSPQVNRISDRTRVAGEADASPMRSPEVEVEGELETDHHQSSTHEGNGRAAADDDEAPQAERTPPRAPGRQQRAVEACELIGDRNHDRAVEAGRVHNVAAHRQACRSSARADHLATAQRLAADHPDWTSRQLAEHLDAPERPANAGPDVKGHMTAVEDARRAYDAALPERAPTDALLSGAAGARARLHTVPAKDAS